MSDQPVAGNTQHSQEIFIPSEGLEPATHPESGNKKGIIYIKIYPASNKDLNLKEYETETYYLRHFKGSSKKNQRLIIGYNK